MYPDLIGKTALVTGAGKKSGIGYAIALKLADSGANVVIADLVKKDDQNQPLVSGNREEMIDLSDELSRRFDVKAAFVAVDVTSNASIKQMADEVKSQFDSVQILCNNAGTVLGVPSAIHTYDDDAWLKTLDVNLNGVFRVSKAVMPLMMNTGGSVSILPPVPPKCPRCSTVPTRWPKPVWSC